MKGHFLLVVIAMALVGGCGATPSPPATQAPSPAPSALAVPSPFLPPPHPPVATVMKCSATTFHPSATLHCHEAITAAIAALPIGHSPVLEAVFSYGRPCPPRMRCSGAFIAPGDRGFVLITFEVGGLEVIRVVKAANGTISTSGPETFDLPA